jgi:hypothetical protein
LTIPRFPPELAMALVRDSRVNVVSAGARTPVITFWNFGPVSLWAVSPAAAARRLSMS